MSETGIERTLSLLRRLMAGERMSVPGLLEEDATRSDATTRRSMALLEKHIPGVQRDPGRPANWTYTGADAFHFCPWCGRKPGRKREYA